MNPALSAWALRNRISMQALEELSAIFTPSIPAYETAGYKPESEAAVQSLVRLEAVRKGLRLWRNNVGALLDSRGVPVRYGLANDSRQLNAMVKSGDLIGWRPVLITTAHIGCTIAQFVSRECKRPYWTYNITDEHEAAQMRWAQMVAKDGGDACFATGEGTL